MKILFISLFFCVCVSVNGQCKLITETDRTTGIESISTKFEEAGRFKSTGKINFKLTRTAYKDSVLRLYILINLKKAKCISFDSKILITTDSGTVTLKLLALKNSEKQYDTNGTVSGLVYCGKDLECFADLTPDNISILKKNAMHGIRVYYPGEFYEFQVINDYRNQSEYFIRTIKCFEQKNN